MKWFDRWFAKKCQESWESARKDLAPNIPESENFDTELCKLITLETMRL